MGEIRVTTIPHVWPAAAVPQPKYGTPDCFGKAVRRQGLVETKPPTSGFGSVDPAPPSLETDVTKLRAALLDLGLPMFERFQALFSLRSLDSDASALVLGESMLVDRSALLRHECAYVLGQMQRPVVIPQLVQAMAHDPNPMVRHEAAEALGAIGTDEVLPHLRRCLAQDPSEDVRESCQVALDHIAYLRDANRL